MDQVPFTQLFSKESEFLMEDFTFENMAQPSSVWCSDYSDAG
jgi:hypothetical protein